MIIYLAYATQLLPLGNLIYSIPISVSGVLGFSELILHELRTQVSAGVRADMPILPMHRWYVKLENRERVAGLES